MPDKTISQLLRDVAILQDRIQKYTTGWVENDFGGVGVGDWTNVHLGTGGAGNVTHNLNATTLNELFIKVEISSDGTETNAQEVQYGYMAFGNNSRYGYAKMWVDADNIKIQTLDGGMIYTNDDGTINVLDTDNYYYRITVYKFTI